MSRLPSPGVTTCSRQIGLHACHISGDTSVRAVAKGLSALPEQRSPSDILDVADAFLFSRGTSFTIDPVHYSGPANTSGTAHDSARVAIPCPLIRAVVAVPARTAFAASVQTRPQWQVSSNPHGLAMAQTRQRDADASHIA